MKPVTWIGSAKRDLLACPSDVITAAGRELERVQRGADPINWKPMPSVGNGTREIRVHLRGAHRVFYVAAFPEAIYVLHVFEKKAQKTPARDLALGQQRYLTMLKGRTAR
jgi:phage-related protein